MIVVFGIKTCGSVQKALKFFKDHDIEVTFHDFKVTPVDEKTLLSWRKDVGTDLLLNTKGTTYKKLNLKECVLNDDEKIGEMVKYNLLIKRPVITDGGKVVIVGYDEGKYQTLFS